MRMDVDEAGHHHQARSVDGFVDMTGEAGADMNDPVIGEDDVAIPR